MLTIEELTPATVYPRELWIDADVLSRGTDYAEVRLCWDVQTVTVGPILQYLFHPFELASEPVAAVQDVLSSGGHVGGEDVVGVSVEVLSGSVVAHGRAGSACRAAICTWRRSTPASSMVVTKVCRSMCGCILGRLTFAAMASPRSRRVAARRSIRAPRRFNRIGHCSRPATARSTARATAGGSEVSTTLPTLAADLQDSVAVLLTEVGDVRDASLEDPQAEETQHRATRSHSVDGVARRGQHRSN